MNHWEAGIGGFSSFYSIWQVCIVQISPFFLVYLFGLAATRQVTGGRPGWLAWILMPSLAYAVGFAPVFALLSSPGLYAGRYLTYYIGPLRVAAGIFFLGVAGWFWLADRWSLVGRGTVAFVAHLVTLILGVAFALIYSPCITPTLSTILGLAVRTETAPQGSLLALSYGLGMSLAFGVFGWGLFALGQSWVGQDHRARRIKDLAAGVFLLLALMNITGAMTAYKAFFLGLLVQ